MPRPGRCIRLQFFASNDFGEVDLSSADLYARAAERRHFPTGGELSAGESAPEFIILAGKDPAGANSWIASRS